MDGTDGTPQKMGHLPSAAARPAPGTLPPVARMTLLEHAIEVGAQVGHRGQALVEGHDAAAGGILLVGNQGLSQLHEEIQPRQVRKRNSG